MSRRAFSALALLLCAAATVALSAQSAKFKVDQGGLHQEAVAARKAKGLDLMDPALEKQYPAATIAPVTVQKVTPGASIAIKVTGKFPAGVGILSDRDGAVLSGGALAPASYTARVTVGPAEGPGFVKLWAFTPVSFAVTSMPVAFIDTIYRFDLRSADGLTVKIAPIENTFTVKNHNATLKYQAEFSKPGETKPFETRVGSMNYYGNQEPRTRLDIAIGDATDSLEQQMEAISTKLEDPKLTAAERNALTQQMMKVRQRMTDDMMKGLQSDPAALNKKADDFGCRLVQVYPGQAGAVRASVLCGKNFRGGAFETTGTMTAVNVK